MSSLLSVIIVVSFQGLKIVIGDYSMSGNSSGIFLRNIQLILFHLESNLRADCMAFFPSRTSVIVIEWSLILLAKYRNIQRDIQMEIDSVIGTERTPSLIDRPLLPRLQAFIAEVFRFKTNTPFGLLRRAVEDTVIDGQNIPKDSDIILNLYSVNNDTNVWQKPEDFNPNRFLSEDGKQFLKNEALIPFGTGMF